MALSEGNPFKALVDQALGGGGQSPMSPAPQMAAPAGAPAAAPMAEQPNPAVPEQLQRGTNSGGTRFLLSAAQAMENYIRESTDPEEIRLARAIMGMVNNLVSRDQQRLVGELKQ